MAVRVVGSFYRRSQTLLARLLSSFATAGVRYCQGDIKRGSIILLCAEISSCGPTIRAICALQRESSCPTRLLQSKPAYAFFNPATMVFNRILTGLLLWGILRGDGRGWNCSRSN